MLRIGLYISLGLASACAATGQLWGLITCLSLAILCFFVLSISE